MKHTTRIIVIAVFMVLGGCSMSESAPRYTAEPTTRPAGPSGDAAYMSKTAVRADAAPKDETAVDTALQWAKKYSEVAEKVAVLQQENLRLSEELAKVRKESEGLRTELDTAKTRLAEADRALKDFDEALREWKKDVLGNREEMREASKAQMIALTRIIKLLSGDVTPASTTQPVGATSMPASSAVTKDMHP